MSSRAKCKVSSDGSVCLQDIVESFNAPIREEHAWALCYQCTKSFSEAYNANPTACIVASAVNHVFLQQDGNVHPKTVYGNENGRQSGTERNITTGLGYLIYNALDYGTGDIQERLFSQDLETLIGDMITDERHERIHQETDDEGIERDASEFDEYINKQTFQHVLKQCERHLVTLTKSQTESHYRAVVRALVAEAIELSTFLERVAQGASNLKADNGSDNTELDQLQFADWARFWVQVISELRMGVKLKKVHYSRAPIEYELTPYEILMKDIRSCRYSLRKIMVDGNAPSRVTKDAHAIILEFIRSRPPLRKASERKLAAHTKVLTPHEQLMNSIRKGSKLRKTPPVPAKRIGLDDEDAGTSNTRRLIKVDFSQLHDDDDDEDTQQSDSSESCGLWAQEESMQIFGSALEAYDLALQCPEPKAAARRHTLGVVNIDSNIGSRSVPQSRPDSRQSCASSDTDSNILAPEIAKVLQDTSKPWHEAMSLDDRLSLTLEEIVHIRTVLTKAELEALPVEGHIKMDVENRKVCFLCLKTRFGLLGPWGHRCTLCKRTVCSKCCSKMNIPMEHFSSVPVVLLSPSIMATPDIENSPFPLSEKSSPGNTLESSPSSSRPGSSLDTRGRFRSKVSAVGKAASVVDKLKGAQMLVCQDCKMMVLQIIRSAQTNRSAIRNKTLQSLTLNLSPVF